MDTPSSSGGNTNSGGLAKRFLDPNNRAKICNLILKGEDRENFTKLLHYFNLLLTVTQSTVSKQKPDIPKVKALGIRLMQHIRTDFVDHCGRSWVPFINSVHELAAQSWQVMQVLEDHQSHLLLVDYTEQKQKAWNKYVNASKSGPSSRARQTSIRDNTQDIFQRMLIMCHTLRLSPRRDRRAVQSVAS